jgi:hypothetical protein
MNEQSKQNIELAFHRALRASVTRAPGDVCAIAPAAGPELREHADGKLLVVTISSFVFRLLTLFQVAANPATREYYVSTAGQSLDEAFREVANLCCGALNRELSQHIPHLAMSIPYTLSSQCIAFLGELRPQYLSSSAITINDTVQLQATLCMCCSAAVEFAASPVVLEQSSGELELF